YRTGTGMPKIKTFTARSICPCCKPLFKPTHNVMGMKITRFTDAFGKAQGHATVVRPETGRLSMKAAVNHTGDRCLPKFLPGAAFYRYSQRIRHTQAIYSIPDFYHTCFSPFNRSNVSLSRWPE